MLLYPVVSARTDLGLFSDATFDVRIAMLINSAVEVVEGWMHRRINPTIRTDYYASRAYRRYRLSRRPDLGESYSLRYETPSGPETLASGLTIDLTGHEPCAVLSDSAFDTAADVGRSITIEQPVGRDRTITLARDDPRTATVSSYTDRRHRYGELVIVGGTVHVCIVDMTLDPPGASSDWSPLN